MDLVINRNDWLDAVSVVSRVTSKKSLPVLGHISVVGESGAWLLHATNLQSSISTKIGDDQAIDGARFLLPAEKLLSILRGYPDGSTVGIRIDGNKGTIRCGRSRFSIDLLSADDYPETKDDKEYSAELTVPCAALHDAITAASLIMPTDDVRYYLNGILLDIANGKLTVAATNGHALIKADVDCGDDWSGYCQSIIPAQSVQEFTKILKSGGDCKILFSKSSISISAGEYQFDTQLISGNYPDINRVIPNDCSDLVIVNSKEIDDVLSRAKIVFDKKTLKIMNVVSLSLSDNKMTISSEDKTENFSEEIDAEYAGQDQELGINCNYLSSAITAVGVDKIKILFRDIQSPVIISSVIEEENNVIGVVMPARL